MATNTSFPLSSINEIGLSIIQQLDDTEPEDIITTAHPIISRLEKKGGIEMEDPAQLYQDAIEFQTPDRGITLSSTVDIQEKNRTPIKTTTATYWKSQLHIQTLTIGEFEYASLIKNGRLATHIRRQKNSIDKATRNRIRDVLWNGYTSGSDHVPGLTEIIQFDPSTDPDSGAIGLVSVSDQPNWANVTYNFNAAFKTMVSGGETTTFLDSGDNCFLSFYQDLTDFDNDKYAPDLIVCNRPMFRYFANLERYGLVFRDENSDLGVPSIKYNDADVFYDSEVPDDPNDSDYGVAMAINTNAYKWVFWNGYKRKWETSRALEGATAYAWDQKTGYAVKVRNRRALGVFYGVKSIASS